MAGEHGVLALAVAHQGEQVGLVRARWRVASHAAGSAVLFGNLVDGGVAAVGGRDRHAGPLDVTPPEGPGLIAHLCGAHQLVAPRLHLGFAARAASADQVLQIGGRLRLSGCHAQEGGHHSAGKSLTPNHFVTPSQNGDTNRR
jgi:hypothetical protein